jgi:hypothetical protein
MSYWGALAVENVLHLGQTDSYDYISWHVRIALDNPCFDVNQRGPETLLTAAARWRPMVVGQILADPRTDPTLTNDRGETALHALITSPPKPGRDEALDFLLSHPRCPLEAALPGTGVTALVMAMQFHCESDVRRLLEAGANVDLAFVGSYGERMRPVDFARTHLPGTHILSMIEHASSRVLRLRLLGWRKSTWRNVSEHASTRERVQAIRQC